MTALVTSSDVSNVAVADSASAATPRRLAYLGTGPPGSSGLAIQLEVARSDQAQPAGWVARNRTACEHGGESGDLEHGSEEGPKAARIEPGARPTRPSLTRSRDPLAGDHERTA
jgi:hypothetical protein